MHYIIDDGRETGNPIGQAHFPQADHPRAFRRLRRLCRECQDAHCIVIEAVTDAEMTLPQSPRSDFEKEVQSAGLGEKVLYLDRGDAFEFGVRG